MNKPQKLYCKWKKLQKTSHCMIPFIYDVQIRQIYRDRKWLFRARGREIEEWRLKTAGFILKLIVVMNVQLCEYIRSHYVFSILSCPVLSCPVLSYPILFCLFFRATPVAYGGSQSRNLHHSPQKCQILNPRRKARNWTHILMDTGQVCYGWATVGTPVVYFKWVNCMVCELYFTKLFF